MLFVIFAFVAADMNKNNLCQTQQRVWRCCTRGGLLSLGDRGWFHHVAHAIMWEGRRGYREGGGGGVLTVAHAMAIDQSLTSHLNNAGTDRYLYMPGASLPGRVSQGVDRTGCYYIVTLIILALLLVCQTELPWGSLLG